MAAAGAAVLVSLLPPGIHRATAAAAPEPGQGVAFAQAFKIDPKAGGLSIGLAFGQATATHQNKVARAIATGTFMGVVGTTLAARQCDDGDPTVPREQQPQPLIVDSRDEGAADGKTHTDSPEYGHLFPKYGRATDTPFAEATARTMAYPHPQFGDGSGFEMGATSSRATSGIVDGVREARATVEVAYIAFPTVGVRLSKLRWDARYQSTGDKKVEGRFTIGSAVVNGEQRNTFNPSATLDLANQALAPIGIKLVPGKVHMRDDMVLIDPLSITVVPNRTRDGAAAAVIGATADGREALFEEILKHYCQAGTYISVFDIVVGSVTGAGEFVLSLGGAQAFSGELVRPDFNLDPGKAGRVGGGFEVPGREASVTVYTTTGPTYAAGSPVAAPGAAPPAAVPPTQRTRLAGSSGDRQSLPPPFEGSRGGALAVVGIVTLAVVALVAEGDRRKMVNARYRAALAAAANGEGEA